MATATTMDATTLVSLAGSLITLFGLLVSLFSIHLGNWLSKLQALRTKWDMNDGSDDKEVNARRECRYGFVEQFNWQPVIMTLIISSFGFTVLYFFNTVRIEQQVTFPSIYVIIYNAFFLIMLTLQIVLLVWGLIVGFRLRRDINAKFNPKPKPSAA